MEPIDITPLETLGLSGDGDEVLAIQAVESRFGVTLDAADAKYWSTVGAVYESLKRALPPVERARRDLWPRFAQAIADETGADPRRVRPETRLLVEKDNRWALFGFAALLVLAWLIYREL